MMWNRVRLRHALGDVTARIGRRRAATAGTLTIFMYHAVTPERIEDAGQMSVSAAGFERQMGELASAGVAVVDLIAGVRELTNGSAPRPSVAITFDDGFAGVHDHAAPVLQRLGWPATVFITTAWIGEDTMPLAERGLGRPLSWREVRALAASGFSIGSHTHTHPRLAQIGRAQIRGEIRESMARVADAIGERPTAFAYPFGAFGSFDGDTRRVLQDEGFAAACTTVFGRNGRGADPLALRRLRMSWCDGEGEPAKAVAGCYDWYAWIQRAQTLGRARAGATPC